LIHVQKFTEVIYRIENYHNINEELAILLITTKLNNKDLSYDEKVIKILQESDSIEAKLYLALYMIEINKEVSSSIHTLIKFILLYKFKNEELNNNFLRSIIKNIKITESENLDKFGFSLLRVIVLEDKDEICKTVIIIPKEWKIPNFDNFIVEYTESNFDFDTLEMQVGDEVFYDNENYKILSVTPLTSFLTQRFMSRQVELGVFHKINVSNGLDQLKEFVRESAAIDQNKKKVLDKTRSEYKCTFIYSFILDSEKMIFYYNDILKNQNIPGFLSTQSNIVISQNQFIISYTSLIFLMNYDLLYILKSYKNIFIDSSILAELNYFIKSDNKRNMVGNLFHDGNGLKMISRDSTRIQEEHKMYRTLISTCRNLPQKKSINEYDTIKKINQFDNNTIFSSIDHNLILISEDYGLQSILADIEKQRTTTIGNFIFDFFLNLDGNIDNLLYLLNEMADDNNLFIISDFYHLQLKKAVKEKNSEETIKSYTLFQLKYSNYCEQYFN
ncbi:hypothetical protein, partial [Macrococcus equipercicus]|uniref:hypothetical protein n=1 Tax=Macrococcus equipercicus TaxID=69967 RepID=UPI00147889D3